MHSTNYIQASIQESDLFTVNLSPIEGQKTNVLVEVESQGVCLSQNFKMLIGRPDSSNVPALPNRFAFRHQKINNAFGGILPKSGRFIHY